MCETVVQSLFFFFKSFENSVQETLLTVHSLMISILTKMVRSRGGKTMSESSSKERTYATSSLLSVRRICRSSAEENTPIATSEKREKTKKI